MGTVATPLAGATVLYRIPHLAVALLINRAVVHALTRVQAAPQLRPVEQHAGRHQLQRRCESKQIHEKRQRVVVDSHGLQQGTQLLVRQLVGILWGVGV
jgi:hypothetical protein